MIVIANQRLLKYTIILLTLNGLSPFVYDKKVQIVKTPKKLFIYSLVVSICLSIFIIFGSIFAEYFYYQRYADESVVLLIIIFEFFFATVKAVVLFILHMLNHNEIEKLINKTIKINRIVTKCTAPTSIFNQRIRKIIKIKILLVFSQIIATTMTLVPQKFFSWFILSYPQIIILLTTSVYIFGGMILNLNFLVCINTKLKFIENNIQIKNKKFKILKWSEEIERVSVLLCKIHKFTMSLNGLYGMYLTLTLIGSLVLILCSVKFTVDFIFKMSFFIIVTSSFNILIIVNP